MIAILASSLHGKSLDILNPVPSDVDFAEIAETLAQINLCGGRTQKPLSAAMHILIACDAGSCDLCPWVLLHHCHKAFLSDIPLSTLDALAHIDAAINFSTSSSIALAMKALKLRHDKAIHLAAGLPLPTQEQIDQIARAYFVAVRTEQRDFRAPPSHELRRYSGDVTPLKKVYRLAAAKDVADLLFILFKTYLPALSGRSLCSSAAEQKE